jgi:hypothetical protein
VEKILEPPTSSNPITLPKNSREELRLALSEYNGHPYADLRVFYRDDDSGEMRPSKKGITVLPGHWPAFRQALDQLEAQMQERGLLADEEGV